MKLKLGDFLACTFLMCLALAACEKSDPVSKLDEAVVNADPPAEPSPAPTPTPWEYVFDASIINLPNGPEKCLLVDQAVIYAKPPLPAELTAIDRLCRTMRYAQTLPVTPGPQANLPPCDGNILGRCAPVPLLLKLDDKVFFGTLDRGALQDAHETCSAIAQLLPGIVQSASPQAGPLAIAATSLTAQPTCDSIKRGLLQDNPLVVVSATTVIGGGVVRSVAQQMQSNPELAKIGKTLESANDKIEAEITASVKKPIEWAQKNPDDALMLLSPTVAVLKDVDPKAAERLAQDVVTTLTLGSAKPADLKAFAENSIGGDAGKAISAAVDAVTKPQQAVSQVGNQVNQAAAKAEDDLRRSDLNPGNWSCCSW